VSEIFNNFVINVAKDIGSSNIKSDESHPSISKIIANTPDIGQNLQLKSEQKEMIQNVLERKDSMAVLPTGFGKSMCYILDMVRSYMQIRQSALHK
jgi:superfamily II DNA or RNA helicase